MVHLRKIYLPEVVCDKETPFSYLFIIGMKVMLSSEMLISAGEKGLVQGIKFSKTASSISHLVFVDNSCIFSNAT